MRFIGHLFLRELRGYFNSLIGYAFLVVLLGFSCGVFNAVHMDGGQAEMRGFFDFMPFWLALFVPALTMRLWAEERKQGTLELLMTFPARSHQLILGKFLGAYAFLLIGLLLTLPLAILYLGWGAEFGPVLGGYLGTALMGAVFVAAGMFISCMTREQIVALLVSIVFCLGILVLLGFDLFVSRANSIIPVPSPGLGTFLGDAVSVMPHFDSIQRGVIDVWNLLYTLTFTALFLLLNWYVLESHVKFHARWNALTAGALAVLVAVFFNLNAGLWRLGRIDMTKEGRYTVSPATFKILNGLKAPVEVTVFLTKREKVPQEMQTLERDIVDLLTEMKAGSPNLEFKVIDPASDRDLEAKYNEEGIKAFPVTAQRKGSAEVKLIYSTIQVNYLEKQERIPGFLPPNLGTLENDLMVIVHRLSAEKQPHIVIFGPWHEVPAWQAELMAKVGRPVPPPRDPFSTLSKLLRNQGYRVSRIRLNSLETMPEDADMLVVVGPEALNDRQRWEINRFLRSGRNVLMAPQMRVFGYDPGLQGEVVARPQLKDQIGNKLLREYGVEVDDRILMDMNFTDKLVVEVSNVPFPVPVTFPNQIVILPDNMNSDSMIVGGVGSLFYLWGSSLKVDGEKLKALNLNQTTLFSSGEKSWFIAADRPRLDLQTLQPKDGTFEGKQALALEIEGIFPDAYAGKDVPLWPDDKQGKPEPPPPLEAKQAKLVVIGCGMMFEDQLLQAAREIGGQNLLFFNNTVDYLALGGDLASIRSKNLAVTQIPTEALQSPLMNFFTTVLLMPLVTVVAGFAWLIIRRRRREAYLAKVREASS